MSVDLRFFFSKNVNASKSFTIMPYGIMTSYTCMYCALNYATVRLIASTIVIYFRQCYYFVMITTLYFCTRTVAYVRTRCFGASKRRALLPFIMFVCFKF